MLTSLLLNNDKLLWYLYSHI